MTDLIYLGTDPSDAVPVSQTSLYRSWLWRAQALENEVPCCGLCLAECLMTGKMVYILSLSVPTALGKMVYILSLYPQR